MHQLVNKQNFDNTKTHGTNVKIIEAQHASLCNSYRNTKLKLLNSCDFSKHKVQVQINELHDDGVTNTETCGGCFNVNFNIVFKTTHWCISG